MGGPSFIARNVGKYGTQGKAGDLRLPGNTGRKNARVNVRPDSITFKESVKAPLALLNHVNSVPGKRKTQNKVCIDEMASMMDCLNKMVRKCNISTTRKQGGKLKKNVNFLQNELTT